MRKFSKVCSQGELRFVRLPDDYKVPKDWKRSRDVAGGKMIIGHSETGHHHVMDDDKVEVYQNPNDPLSRVLVVKESASLDHLRPHHTHESIGFDVGAFTLRTGREHVPGSDVARQSYD
jgi:hypothetical protein